MSKTFTSRAAQVSQRGRGRGGNTRGASQTRSQPTLPSGERLNNSNTRGGAGNRNRNETSASGTTVSATAGLRGRGQARNVRKTTAATASIPSTSRPSNTYRKKMSGQPENMAGPSREHDEQQQQTSQMGGFTVTSPNEKKRQQIAQQAKNEEEAYLAHQREKTQQSYNYVGTAGGGLATESEARMRQMKAHRNAKLTNLEKPRKWREETKRKEEEEISQRLSKARVQSLQNEQRRRSQADKNTEKWDEDRRRKNDDFLSRLERQSQESYAEQQDKEQRESAGHARQEKAAPVKAPDKPTNTGESQYAEYQSADFGREADSHYTEVESSLRQSESAYRRQSESAHYQSESESAHYQSESETTHYQSKSESNPLEGLSSEQIAVILTLQDMFPQYTLDSLTEIAAQSDYSLDTSVILLSD